MPPSRMRARTSDFGRFLFYAVATSLLLIAGPVIAGAAADEPKRIFGTHSCDREAMAESASKPGHSFADGDLVSGKAAPSKSAGKADHFCIGWTLDRVPSNATVRWGDRSSGAQFALTPIRTYEAPNGERCRDYAVIIANGQHRERRINSACRDVTGAWRFGSPYADPTGVPNGPWEGWDDHADVPKLDDIDGPGM